MMQRIPFGSPAKENLQASPSKKHKTDLYDLLNFLKTSGVAIPPQLAHLLNFNPESPLKQRNSLDEAKRLRVQLSESEFQLKKVEEDFAEFRRQSKIQKEREAKKSQDQLNKLKATLESSCENSSYKLEKLVQDHEAQKKALKEKQKLQLQQEVAKVREALQAKLNSQEKLHKREMTEQAHNNAQQLAELTKTHRDTLTQVQERAEKEMQEVKGRHRAVLQEKEKRHQSIRVALESERKTQEKLHEKTKLDASKEKEKLICELCFEKNTRTQLEQEAQEREKEIRRLRSTINDLQVDIHLLDEKFKKKIEDMKQQYQIKHQQALKKFQGSLREVMEKHAQQLTQLEERLQKMDQIHQQKVDLMSQNTEELSDCFERRPSKPQDLSEIDKLKWALAKKEEEVRKLMRELKHCNLELENKEEIYTRIFRGNSVSREKRSTPKEDRQQICIDEKLGKENPFRKSQTADVKFLLKIYNNTKNA